MLAMQLQPRLQLTPTMAMLTPLSAAANRAQMLCRCQILTQIHQSSQKEKSREQKCLHELQNNIVGIISTKINERADNLESMINHNTVSIDALKKSIDFAFAKVDSLKTDMKVVKTTTEKNEQKLSELELKLNDAERYQRRWNLRLHGVPEEKQEDIKAKVITICCSMVPDAHAKIRKDIDIVHRLGRYQENMRRSRTTIIRITNRSTRDLLWKKAKTCEYLTKNKLTFAEDLTSAEKTLRDKLWPIIEAAKKEGKKADFAGVRVIIDGKEVRPSLPPK